MCDAAVMKDPWLLVYVPNWFITQQQVNIHDDDNKLIKYHNGYPERRDQKAQIKKELMPIAWHPSRWWDWCISEAVKKETEKL